MSHTYSSLLVHAVFSTKERRPFITPEMTARLTPYLGGIAREHGMRALAIGGVEDHAHMLLSLPPTLSVSKAMQLIKGGSSKWIHDTFPSQRRFAWQEGYGAFSIGIRNVGETTEYINDQEAHHQKRNFKDELVAFLRGHNIEFDERYLLG